MLNESLDLEVCYYDRVMPLSECRLDGARSLSFYLHVFDTYAST